MYAQVYKLVHKVVNESIACTDSPKIITILGSNSSLWPSLQIGCNSLVQFHDQDPKFSKTTIPTKILVKIKILQANLSFFKSLKHKLQID